MDNRPNVSGGLYSELKAKLFSLKTFCLETFKLTFLNHKSINLPKISVLFGEERHLNSKLGCRTKRVTLTQIFHKTVTH
jgi:hypothetical protein